MDFGSLYAACDRIGERLQEAKGNRGTLLVEAHGQLGTLVALLAGLWSGRWVLPVAPKTPASELAVLVERVGAEVAIGSRGFLERLPADFGARVPAGEILAGAEPRFAKAGLPRETGSILLQSSGTGGPPKIVRRNGAALHAVGRNLARALSLGGDDAMLICIPLSHSYAIDMFSAALVAGCALHVHDGFVPARVTNAFREGSISIWPAVPVMLDALSRVQSAEAPIPGLRKVISAGSPLPRRVYDQFEAAYGLRVAQLYGSSEFGSVTCGDPEDPGFDPASVGFPFDGVEVRVEPAGEEGEVRVAAPSMMQEYLGEPPPFDAQAFLPTGDLGRLDEMGRLTITGRIKFLIDVGGQKVNPLEVEQVLEEHPEVSEAVVVRIPWSDTSDRHRAVIIPKQGCSPEAGELRRFAQKHLSSYKVPRSFRLRLDVPRSPTGKILRTQLQELEQAAVEGS